MSKLININYLKIKNIKENILHISKRSMLKLNQKGMGTVEIIIIIAVLVALALLFKTFILDDGWSYDDRKRVSPQTIVNWYQDVGKWDVFFFFLFRRFTEIFNYFLNISHTEFFIKYPLC